MKSNSQITKQALALLKGNWGYIIIAYIVYLAASFISSPVSIVVGGPLAVGLAIFNLNFIREEEFNIDQLFLGFRNFGTAFGAFLLTMIIVCVGFFLLIIPGIIAGIMLSQVFFVIADDPEIGIVEALEKSRDIMDGYKWQYFFLLLQFALLSLLGIITLGIAFIWLIPYYQVSLSCFYDALKEPTEETFV